MRILWLVNFSLPEVNEKLRWPVTHFGSSWIVSLSKEITKKKEIDLAVASIEKVKKLSMVKIGRISNYLIPGKEKTKLTNDSSIKKYYEEIISEFKPDIINIFGAEYSHSLPLLELDIKVPVAVWLQGLVSVYQKYFFAGIKAQEIEKTTTFRDFIKRDNLFEQYEKYSLRGSYEKEILSKVENVIGRTAWDRLNSLKINPNLKYYFVDDLIRRDFFLANWNFKNKQKYRIFITQAYSPIKGLHLLIRAAGKLVNEFPDLEIAVGGPDFVRTRTLKERMKISGYGKYVKYLIKKNKLESKIVFCGNMDSSDVISQLLKAHVFVLSSSIENSPNSLAEAMIVGVPCVSANVGGVPNMTKNNLNGLLYNFKDIDALAENIKKIFLNDELALKLSQNARRDSRKRFRNDINVKRLLEVYQRIINEEK